MKGFSMKGKAILVLAGIVLAGASTIASAAKPPMTHQQKKELAAQAQKKVAADIATQPRTSGQALTTKRTIAGGAQTMRVPTELWTTLATQQEADGTLRVLESDGTAAPATEGLPNE
jgi:hypothetical protein